MSLSSAAAELIAKIKVNGFSEYEATMHNAGRAMDTLAGKAAQMGQTLTRHLLTPLNAVLGLATGAGMIGLTHSAIDQAAKIERLRMTYAALSGDLESAGRKMQFLNKFAETSIAHFDDLAEAGTILEASGLRMERFLPTINNIAGAFGGTSEQVMELTEAIARLTSGQMGESERVFRRFGITMSDFMAAGLRVGAGGQIQASAEQILSAVEHVAQRKFGNIGTVMGSTMTVRFSNLQDAWHKMLDSFGQGWFPFIGKVLDSLTPFMDFLTRSGILEQIGQAFANTLSSLAGISDGDSIPKFLSYVAALVENLPQLFSTVGRHIAGMLQTTADAFVGFVNVAKNALIFGLNNTKHVIEGIVNTISAGIYRLQAIGAAVTGQSVDAPKPFKAGNDFHMDDFKSPADMFNRFVPWLTGGIGDNIGKRADDIFKQYQNFQKQPKADGQDGPYGMFNENYVPGMAQHLRNIDHSTAKMADLKRFALGGGDLGQMGITPAEMYGGNRVINIHAGGAAKAIEMAIHQIASEVALQMARQRGSGERYISG